MHIQIPFRLVRRGGILALVPLLAAGCSHHGLNTPLPAPPATPVASQPVSTAVPGTPPSGTQSFQPYTLLPQPAPKPKVVTHHNRVLHLVERGSHPYLADSEGHAYEVGRDAQGHLYPIYRDPVTREAYPLYYDSDRDRFYRVARADDRRFYRNYVGDPGDRFYASDRDYEHFTPSEEDRPVIENSDNTTYNTYDYGAAHRHFLGTESRPAYPPPAHHDSSHNNSDWLWAIPVVVGAYLLLQPHHHSAPPAPHYVSRRTLPPAVVRNVYNNHIINNHIVTNNTVVTHHNLVINNTINKRPGFVVNPARPPRFPNPVVLPLHPHIPLNAPHSSVPTHSVMVHRVMPATVHQAVVRAASLHALQPKIASKTGLPHPRVVPKPRVFPSLVVPHPRRPVLPHPMIGRHTAAPHAASPIPPLHVAMPPAPRLRPQSHGTPRLPHIISPAMPRTVSARRVPSPPLARIHAEPRRKGARPAAPVFHPQIPRPRMQPVVRHDAPKSAPKPTAPQPRPQHPTERKDDHDQKKS